MRNLFSKVFFIELQCVDVNVLQYYNVNMLTTLLQKLRAPKKWREPTLFGVFSFFTLTLLIYLI